MTAKEYYLNQVGSLFCYSENLKLSLPKIFELGSHSWLTEIKKEILSSVNLECTITEAVVVSFPERMSQLLMAFMNNVRKLSASFFLSTEIFDEVIIVPTHFQYAIFSDPEHETFITFLDGEVDCFFGKEKLDITLLKTLHVPAKTKVFLHTKSNTLIWAKRIKKMSIINGLEAILARAMHHHPIMRMGLPLQIAPTEVLYKTSVFSELYQLIGLLKQELSHYNNILNNPHLTFELT